MSVRGCVFVYMCVCVYVCMCVCVGGCVCVYLGVYVCVCVYVCVSSINNYYKQLLFTANTLFTTVYTLMNVLGRAHLTHHYKHVVEMLLYVSVIKYINYGIMINYYAIT